MNNQEDQRNISKFVENNENGWTKPPEKDSTTWNSKRVEHRSMRGRWHLSYF